MKPEINLKNEDLKRQVQLLSIESQTFQSKLFEREKEFQNLITVEKKNEILINESKILSQKLEKTLQMNSILNDKLNNCNINDQELKSLEAKIPLLVKQKFF